MRKTKTRSYESIDYVEVLVQTCQPEVRRLKRTVYRSVLDQTDGGPWHKGARPRVRRIALEAPQATCAASEVNGAPRVRELVGPVSPHKSKARRLEALLNGWLSDDTGYDEETWPELKKALDKDRLSSRRLFRE